MRAYWKAAAPRRVAFEKPGDAGVKHESHVWTFRSFQITDWSIRTHRHFWILSEEQVTSAI